MTEKKSFTSSLKPKSQSQGFADKILAQSVPAYYLTHTKPDGSRTYYFVIVDKAKNGTFRKELEKGMLFDFTEFGGDVVAEGVGNAPQELKTEMAEKYGIEYNDE